jgi:large subunit ribosomal protein L22
MGQKENPKRTGEHEARAYAKYLRASPQKLNLVAQTIRGKNAGRALIDLKFSRRRIAQDVRKLLQSAIANAENNHGLDVDRLVVSEASVGKTLVMKRWRARARGRAAPVEKKFSNMTIIVKEQNAEAPKAKKAKSAKPAAKAEKAPAKAPAKKSKKQPQGDKE